MELSLAELLNINNLVNVALFLLEPIILIIICKLIINTALKVTTGIFDKTGLDNSIKKFCTSALKIAAWTLAIIIVAGSIGIDTASLVTVVGVASLALSLSVQNIFTNVFSGIVLLITKPFNTGDYIDVCGVSGTVIAIDIMRTTINTVDNKVELVPNGDIAASRITNYSAEKKRRVDFVFTASYDADTELVKKAIMEVLDSHELILQNEDKMVRLKGYNANDIEYVVRVWTETANYWDVYWDVNEQVRESYKKYGIEFSYPHVVLHQATK